MNKQMIDFLIRAKKQSAIKKKSFTNAIFTEDSLSKE